MTTSVRTVELTGRDLTIADLVGLARPGAVPRRTGLAPDAEAAMNRSVRLKNELLDREVPLYGITTGFGDSCGRQVPAEKAGALQRNLIRYHLNGTGRTADADVVRATMAVRANCLAGGASAIRPSVVRALLALLDRGLVPQVPERGSLGASGDLVPLAYVASALVGEGEIADGGRVGPAADVLAAHGLDPVVPAPKEGLSLMNGTSFTTAVAALALHDAAELADVADIATAITCEGLTGNVSHFEEFVHRAKPHPGQITSAANVAALVRGSALTTSYDEIVDAEPRLDGRGVLELEQRIQDPYSVRCAPHVVGVLRDTVDAVTPWLEVEMNSATDNPLFDDESGRIHHGGNFYAGHAGHAAENVKVATANVADLLDRQLALLVDARYSRGLPANLIVPRTEDDPESGLHHGFKGMQIAASALTAEALKTASPASVFSRSTESHNQDKVSMGAIAARDARLVVELTREVAAIHLLAAAQAVELRGLADASPAVRRAVTLLRKEVPALDVDRRMDADVRAVVDLITSGELRRAVDADLVRPR